MLWEIEIRPRTGDVERERVAADYELLSHRAGAELFHATARGFIVEGQIDRTTADRLAHELLHDPIVETTEVVLLPGAPPERPTATVVLKPGVMDPAADSVVEAAGDLGIRLKAARTFRRYEFTRTLTADERELLYRKVLANEAIEQVVAGRPLVEHLTLGTAYEFRKVTVPLLQLDDASLDRLSRDGQLALSLDEMRCVQDHFRLIGRDPTDIELETIAQTWSEHCSHKTLKGRVECDDGRVYDNLLKETIFAATVKVRELLGPDDWCVSVFEDNAGIVKFDERFHLCFKVETHNRPSAIEPYGGANTGLGGVIRDVLGCGLGARPVANTDVFCFALPDTPVESLPPGVLHPRRVMRGVVAGVRDYGNRIGIPTVNGAVLFDERYLANPLVFCGTLGLIPVGMEKKQACAGDLIVALGGRTGRDGIHGATFSSLGLSADSEQVGGGAVQIGNAITEKKLLDVLLQARDLGLYTAVTDCGAGGFSSAIGEMGAELGAEVHLDRAPLKYDGLSYTEIWISEAQERMILAVPPAKWNVCRALCASEGVEATDLGAFAASGRLRLHYRGELVGDIAMEFLHEGRPKVVRQAIIAQGLKSKQKSEDVNVVCPACGKRMVKRISRRGAFLGCSGYPECRTTMTFGADGKPQLTSRKTDRTCEKCGSPMLWREGRKGPFLGCSSYPKCRNIVELTAMNGTEAVPDTNSDGLLESDRTSIIPKVGELSNGSQRARNEEDFGLVLKRILAAPSVRSKEAIIRLYDHEVQGGSVLKPLVGINEDGPGDAAVVAPVLGATHGFAVACGINPRYGDLDPFAMAACAIDEAVRNLVAVGADPSRIALLDNFCWGNTNDPATLGTLVRACEACRDLSIAWRMPFISGKDSLHNEYKSHGRHIAIPGTLLISAVGLVRDIRLCVSMDLKEPGHRLYLVGRTRDELGGSHYELVTDRAGGAAPQVDCELALQLFARLHAAMQAGLIRACHDLSEGGLALAAAEMAFAGGVGADILCPDTAMLDTAAWLFSESPTRWLVEVTEENAAAFEAQFVGLPAACVGKTVRDSRLRMADTNGEWAIWAALAELKAAWQTPLGI